LKLSGFLASEICGSNAKSYENRTSQFWGGGGNIFFTPHISPNFGHRELKIYMTLDLHGPHLHSEFGDPNLENVAWGTIIEIKNLNCSGGCRFRIKIQVRGLQEH